MRLKPPKPPRKWRGVPISQQIKSEVIRKYKARHESGSWWVSTPADKFYEVAHQRDKEMQFDPIWTKPDKLIPIGHV